MKNPALKDTKSPIDARLISLYSRDTHSGIRPLTESGQYYTFNYYDAIEVEEVKCENTSVLYAAYKQTIEKWENHGTPYNAKQFLLAFIDVLENGEEGYSEKEIKEFWDNTEFPLFFVTMINISNHDDIENVLNKIKNLFPPKQYLPYLTFDHCDIILFSRSNSFADYASQIFKLNYEGLPVIADSITLCTIPSKVNLDIDEKFGIYLRIGVRDYAAAEKFNKKIREYYQKKSQRRAIKQYRLLGRNDIGFYNPIATLKWLS